jgi:small-conductance mechanosensitive channel
MTSYTNKDGTNRTPRDNKVLIRSIIGIGLLLAVASIGYSTVTIVLGTNGWTPSILLIPQVVLAVTILIWKFCFSK